MRARPSFLQSEVFPYGSIEVVRVPFLARPSTTAMLDAMLADNARVDAELAKQTPEQPNPTPAPIRQPDLAKPAQAEKWYEANCPSWRKGGAK